MSDDKITISTYQFLKRFPNSEAARVYLEARRWPQGAICPACGCVERIQPCKNSGLRIQTLPTQCLPKLMPNVDYPP